MEDKCCFTESKIDEISIAVPPICNGRLFPTVVNFDPYFIDEVTAKDEDEDFYNSIHYRSKDSCNNYNYIVIIYKNINYYLC